MYDFDKLKKDIAKLTNSGYPTEENAIQATLDELHDFLEDIRFSQYTSKLIDAVSFYLLHSKDGAAIKAQVADALQTAIHNDCNALRYNNATMTVLAALDKHYEP